MYQQYYIYILTNEHNTTLYTGVTNNLLRRVYEHKNKLVDGFTNKYNVEKLVYFEPYLSAIDAIAREKQIKAGPRAKKLELINNSNPEWRDLYEDLIQ